jgi:transmembrane sensor
MNELVTAQTLYNYFEKKATLREEQLIKEWLKQDGHEEIFYHHLSVWESLHLQVDVDVDQAMARYKKVLAGEAPVRTLPPPRTPSHMQRRMKRYAYMAGAAAFILSLCLFYYQHYYLYTKYLTDYGMTRDIVLEDGSEVILNANSSLKVRKQLNGPREVWLEGEAFFSVAKKQDGARFVVHTDNVSVEVLGTKFNVNSRRKETEVVLKEGSIRLTSDLPEVIETLLMKPGDLVSLSDHDAAFRMKTVQPDRYSAWRNNVMVFEDAPLSVVAREIEDYYGMPVEIADKELMKSALTGTLPNNNLGIVLKSLSASLKLTVTRKDDKIILTR